MARGVSALFALAALSALSAPAARADDWEIERSAKPARSAQARPRAQARAGAANAGAQDAQRTRYLELVLRSPSDAAAFDRLASLYRARDGNLEGLQLEIDEKIAALSSANADARADAKVRQPLALYVLKGRVHQTLGQLDAARAAFESARERPRDDPRAPSKTAPGAALPWILGAQLEQRAGELERARVLWTRAVELANDRAVRRDAIEQLAEVLLDLKDFAATERAFAELARDEPASPFAATALARALSAHGEHARAAAAYEGALKGLAGDPRVLAPIRIEQARSEIEAGLFPNALETLARAQREGAGEGIRHAASELLLDAHRRAGTLAALAEQLERASAGSFEQAELLARLQEELGNHAQAERALERALAHRPTHAQTRERLVRLLLLQGRLAEAIAEQQKLVKAAPSEPRYVTSLAQALLEAGMRREALALLEQTERKHGNDARIVRALLDVYSRWGEHERARRMLERLAALEPGDPSYALALGRELLDRGDETGSRAAFARAIERASDRAEAHLALGELLLDSDRAELAIEQLEHALKLRPDHPPSVRALAEALERTKRWPDAEAHWRKLMDFGDKTDRRDARRRLVLLWSQTGELRRKTRELEAAFAGSPNPVPPNAASSNAASQKPASPDRARAPVAPDLEAGRFLAECYRVLANAGRHGSSDASLAQATERTLVRILELAPGDLESMLALERSLAARRDLRAASAVLDKLLQADPANAAAYLAKLAQYALLEYRDADAIAYAERLVTLAPGDAAAHVRLAELYRGRQDVAHAVRSYERAIELDPSAFPAAGALADLLLSTGEQARADALLRRIVAGSPDDELVRKAARSLFQIHTGSGTLASLELDLLGLAMRDDPRAGIHRELLLELYLALTQPLIEQIARGGAQAQAAIEQLRAIGQRAIKPLLHALTSSDPGARSVAIDVLGATKNAAALLPLLDAAERAGDMALRRRALLAVGMFDSALDTVTARLSALATGEESRLRDLAAWALARTALAQGGGTRGARSTSTERALLALTASETPAVRGYALLGLARVGGPALIERALSALEHDRNPWVRGAAALALGHAGAQAHEPELIATLQVDVDEVAACAALALGMLGAHDATRAFAARIFEGNEWSSRASAWALLRMTGGAVPAPIAVALAAPADRVALPLLLTAYLERQETRTSTLESAVVLELVRALSAALTTSGPSAKSALRALTDADRGLPGWSAALTGQLLAGAVQPLETLATRGDPELRALALQLLVRFAPDRGQAALIAGLAEPSPEIRRVALAAAESLSMQGDPPHGFVSALAAIALQEPLWPLRQRSIRLLASIANVSESTLAIAQSALLHALEQDQSAFVRQAAARALGTQMPALATPQRETVRAALQAAIARDPEARVRAEAKAALDDVGMRPPDVPFR